MKTGSLTEKFFVHMIKTMFQKTGLNKFHQYEQKFFQFFMYFLLKPFLGHLSKC